MLYSLCGFVLILASSLALASPTQGELSTMSKYFDVQVRYATESVISTIDAVIKGHRGSRGEASENTLPAFAW
jgi:hypothetical protein